MLASWTYEGWADDGGGGESPHRAKTGLAGDPGETAGSSGTGGAADSSRAAAAGRGVAGGGGAAGGGASAVGEPVGEEAEAGRGAGAGGEELSYQNFVPG